MRRLSVISARRRWTLAAASAGGAAALVAAMAPATSAVAAAQATPVPHLSGTATYHGKFEHATRLAFTATHGLLGLHAVKNSVKPRGAILVQNGNLMLQFRSPGGPDPAGKATGNLAPSVRSGALVGHAITPRTTTVTLMHAFNGLSDLDNHTVNGFHTTPPDQGLCIGNAQALGGPNVKVVFEANNDVAAIYSYSGTMIGTPFRLTSLFGDPGASGDVRCLYDPKTASFYFSEIGTLQSGTDVGLSALDITVLNSHGAASYQVDNTENGNCFPDQPKIGFDNNALVVSTDQYCGPSQTNYEGALLLAFSKAQMVAGDTSVNVAAFPSISLAGIPVVGLDPAINTGTGTSYLVNSFPYNAVGNNNALSNALGLWKLKGDATLNTGTPNITLTGKVIGSENYAFPVPALSTGDGTTPSGQPTFVINEPALNPDDSRLSGPVNVTHNAEGTVQLWTALDAAVVAGNPAAVDGAAWFKIDTGLQKVVSQGYVSVKGANLLYPAIAAPASGPAAMVFSITSPTLNPGAAYTSLGSGKVTIVGAGAGPHWSFSDKLFNQPRWGDYSVATIDPGTNGIWMATEYIPPAQDQSTIDNWGTYVFKLSR